MTGLDHVVLDEHGLAVYVGHGAAAIPEIVRRLEEVGVRPATVQLARPTLDDVFLDATGRRIEGPGTSDATIEGAA
jgi:ABC-2 type transport system ATP-binding protein